jgi:hypothetical protein
MRLRRSKEPGAKSKEQRAGSVIERSEVRGRRTAGQQAGAFGAVIGYPAGPVGDSLRAVGSAPEAGPEAGPGYRGGAGFQCPQPVNFGRKRGEYRRPIASCDS